jgi:hypothetical protein
MPLELGMAIALRYLQDVVPRKHDWLVLVPNNHDYRFVSDLRAFDLETHEGTVDTIVPKVMAWLATRDPQVPTLNPLQVVDALPRFATNLGALRQQWMTGNLRWDLVLQAAGDAMPQF